MRLVALLTCLGLLGCFPNNPKHQRYAKIVEGGVLVGGVVILAVTKSGADCDMDVGLGMPKQDCKSRASLISGIGLAMVLGGIVGFMATVASGETKQTTTTPPPAPPTPPAPADTKQTPAAPSVTPTPIPAPAPAPAPDPAPAPAPAP